MPLLSSIISWMSAKRVSEIELFKKYPNEVQYETFAKLLSFAKNTEWGSNYEFSSIKTISEFKNRVPLQNYNSLKNDIERTRLGEQNILWPTEIKWFAKSSGTTSDKSKFIPVSKESIEDCHFKGGKDILALYTSQYPETGIYKGKGLTLGGSHQINNYSNESYYGDLSAVIIENLPFWAEFFRTPRPEIALMDVWDEKIQKIAEETINQNITQIAGVPSWTLVLAKHILEITGKKNLLEIWPDLELFVHGGVSFNPYREQFNKLIPSNKMNYLETYNASEGFFAIQNNLQHDDMLLMLDYGIFYEFMPISEVDKEHPTTLDLSEVEIDKNYALVISTNGGLWRYVIGDTIKFTHLQPYKIKITGRIKHFINAFGEELIIDNAEKAIKIASEKCNVEVVEYTAGPIYMTDTSRGGHQWLVEFQKQPNNIEYFINILDTALKSLNSDYEAKRYKNLSLDTPKIEVLKSGTFYKWLKEKGKLGGQHKIPRLANHRDYIEEILKINNQTK